MNNTASEDILIVTGLSGAGISSALKHLEDLGYEVFDNFPLSLIKPLLDDPERDQTRPIAVGVDTRSRGFDPEKTLSTSKDLGARLIFLTADEPTLQKRFTETRRRHPLSEDRAVMAGIRKEKEWLGPMQSKAPLTIDTSKLSIHDLRRVIEGHFADSTGNKLTVTVMSFGFRYGLPPESDIVMDVRFLKNPHWVPEIKPMTGLDKPVGEYIETDDSFGDLKDNLKNLIQPLLPRYRAEGKRYLTIAIGCTGGKHRSVYTTENLAKWLNKEDIELNIVHRDIEKSKAR